MDETKPDCMCGHKDEEHQYDVVPAPVQLAIKRGELKRTCMLCACPHYEAKP